MDTDRPTASESHRRAALDELLAKQAITEVLHRYCYAMDTNDAELGYQVWHDDGTAHYEGMFDGSGRDFVDFGQAGHRATFDATSHQVTNIAITIDGNRATSASYVTAACRFRETGLVYLIRGRYLDAWSCRESTWRIDTRRFVTDLWQIVPSNQEFMPVVDASAPS